MTTPSNPYAGLIERLRQSEHAFRTYPVYSMDGDPTLLTVQADELKEAQVALSRLTRERDAARELLVIATKRQASDDQRIKELEGQLRATTVRLTRDVEEAKGVVGICLKAERERQANLKPSSPASTYTAQRIARLDATLIRLSRPTELGDGK